MDTRQIGKRVGLTIVAAFAAALAASSAPPPAAAASHVKASLVPTAKDPNAGGHANLVVRSSRGKLKIMGERLSRNGSFEVIVDSVRIGTLATGPGGTGKARFSTTPHGRDQLLGVDPRGKLIEVRDQDGDDVLETEMPGDTPPGAIRCCVAGEDETECEEETAAECDARHGVNMGEGSCMPNPCAGTSGGQVRCCIPDHDEDGPECEEVAADQCSAAGGVSLGGDAQCDDHACAPTPPPTDEIRCCIAEQEDHVQSGGDGEDDGDGHEGGEPPECERLTADACAALHGTNLGAGSCDPNPCAASPMGAFVGDR